MKEKVRFGGPTHRSRQRHDYRRAPSVIRAESFRPRLDWFSICPLMLRSV